MKNKLISSTLLFIFVISLTTQSFAQTMPAGADPKIWERAVKLHKEAIIVDGHNDITTPMYDEDFDLGTSSVGKFHFDGDLTNPSQTPYHSDIARFRASGLTGEFFSIYVSGDYAKAGGSMAHAVNQIDSVYRLTEKYPNDFALCTTVADIRRAKKQNRICALMGIEGGHAIEDSLAALREFYRLGVRYMTLTHNNSNDWADSNRASEMRHDGLTDFGKDVVREMNRLGMLVDVAHVSDKTMSDALDVSTAPIIASHSSARALAGHPRNIPDELLKRFTKNGGVVMVNFYPAFLDQRYWDEDRARDAKFKTQLGALREKYKNDNARYEAEKRKLFDANPIYVPSYTRIVDHIDHIRDVAGIDHVGIGSDFDGVPILPEGMNGAEDLVLITYEMLRRGYTETDIRKVLGENFLRAFAEVERVAHIESRKISGGGNLRKINK